MRRFALRPKTFFGLFVAALAFALGLAGAGLWPRRAASPLTLPTPDAATAPAQATVTVRDTFADEVETEEAVFAFRMEDDGEASAVYAPALSTPLSKRERDRPVLEEMRAAWHLQPIE